LCQAEAFTKIRRPILGVKLIFVMSLLGNGVPRLVDCAPLVAAACRHPVEAALLRADGGGIRFGRGMYTV